MPRIQLLPVHLVNKIAAGEVIERPASVVKELVENAIDAQATRIDVVVEDGGKRLVSVADDGMGMDEDDLRLAFLPHATSKLHGEEDLFNIATMGFRGEALASIASISRCVVRTRPRESHDGVGYEVNASGNSISDIRPSPAPPGTMIAVRDLFYNTPARCKFLRTTNTELGHVSEQLTRLALPHPQVAFTLRHGNREMQNLPPADSTLQRVRDAFGPERADQLMPLMARETPGVSVQGLISRPTGARASASVQYFFLNGRYVRDRLLAHALREAYRGRMDSSRYPVAYIFLTVPPDEVDVNVHPTKIEVRFKNGQLIHGQLLAALRDTLNRSELSSAGVELSASTQYETDGGSTGFDGPSEDDVPAEQRRSRLREAMADFFKSAPKPQPRLSFGEVNAPHRPRQPNAGTENDPPPTKLYQSESYSPSVYLADAEPSGATPAADSVDRDIRPRPVPDVTPQAMPSLQVHNSYIVVSGLDGLEIIDQHALHERILYNELKGRLSTGALDGQRMLIPETLPVSESELAAVEECSELLGKLGIEVERFGPGTLAIQRFPSLLAGRGISPVPFVRNVLDRLADDETTDAERLLEDLLEMLACKAAVKAGDPLTPSEIDALLSRRHGVEKVGSCPHGRPTTLKMSLRELEKHFKRT